MHDVPGATHWHEPTGGKRAGFGKFGRPKTPYDNFMESEGIPVFRDIGVSKVQNLPLAPWKRTGGRGTYIQLHGTEGKWGSYVIEVPGAGALNPEKHIYEEIYFVVEGRGTDRGLARQATTSATCSNGRRARCSRFPVNAWHRIVNATRRAGAAARRHHRAEPDEPDQQRRRDLRLPVSVPRPLLAAPTTSTSTRTTSSPIRCAASPCGAPTSCPTSSTATCRSTTAARPASAASSRS